MRPGRRRGHDGAVSLGLRRGREACWAVRAGAQGIRIKVVTEKRGGSTSGTTPRPPTWMS